MKSSQLHSISPISVVPRIRLSKGLAALFAAALAMGLGAESALAQGGYYPQLNPLGGLPGAPDRFIPNGVPVITNPELNLIEYYMGATYTLIIPPVAPKITGTPVQALAAYKAAVQAAAAAVAGGPVGTVTVATLAREVAKYHQGPPSQVADGLGAMAAGLIAAGGGVQANLQTLASNAAQVDPAGATSGGLLFQVMTKAVAGGLGAGVGAITNSALSGAVAGTPPPVALSSAGVRALVGNAVSALGGSPALIQALPTLLMVNPAILGSPANIDSASAALLTVGTGVSANSMTTAIKLALPVIERTDANLGAIAQGALRSNSAASAAIDAALGNPYATNLIAAYVTFTGPGAAVPQATTYGHVAAAAAGATKYGQAGAVTIVPAILGDADLLGLGQIVAQDIVNRGIAAANGTSPQTIASAAVTAPNPTATRVEDVTTGAIKGAPIGSAGVVAKAVVLAGGPGSAATVGQFAIKAAAFISPAANKPDAYADIAYNLSAGLGAGAAGQAAVTAEVAAILSVSATGPTYIAPVSAAAAVSGVANHNAILAAGLGGGAVNDAAASAGVGLLNNLTNVPLSNYQATLAAVAAAGTDERNLAVLYAASLGNAGDAVGGLAALIAKTSTSPVALTAAAISANRSKQTGLTIAADVAVYAKGNPTGDIQATIGRQILDNPTYAKEITAAATVVLPQFSHNIAHTVAFNQPKTAFDSVAGIFLHSRITNTVGAAGIDRLTVGDRPAASAAITAALATGILESTTLTAAERKTALQGAIVESVKALVNPLYNDVTAGPAAFRQSDGATAASFTLVKAKGVAGGITGFVAQLVNSTDTAVVVNPASDIYNALFQASYNAGVLTGTAYQLDIAQAAAQAFAWITGIGVSPAAVTDIANAVFNGYPVGGAAQLLKVQNAVAFGLSEGAAHINPGAGAGGLREGADPFYTHKSAQGRPVSNIFSL